MIYLLMVAVIVSSFQKKGEFRGLGIRKLPPKSIYGDLVLVLLTGTLLLVLLYHGALTVEDQLTPAPALSTEAHAFVGGKGGVPSEHEHSSVADHLAALFVTFGAIFWLRLKGMRRLRRIFAFAPIGRPRPVCLHSFLLTTAPLLQVFRL